MLIRPARPADLAALDALFERAYPRLLAPDYPPSVLVTALPRIARAQPALCASGTYWVAERDGAILGAGRWTAAAPALRPAIPGRGYVRHVVTDDRAVRQGIGRAVMQAAMTQARAAGITWLDCMATRTAVPFYAALGFVSRGPVTVTLAPGVDFPAVAMLRNLIP